MPIEKETRREMKEVESTDVYYSCDGFLEGEEGCPNRSMKRSEMNYLAKNPDISGYNTTSPPTPFNWDGAIILCDQCFEKFQTHLAEEFNLHFSTLGEAVPMPKYPTNNMKL